MDRRSVSVASAPAASGRGALRERIAAEIAAAGGWLGFERFMELALYAPGLGYYARSDRQFGTLPSSGSDFVTAPELTPRFGHTLAGNINGGQRRIGGGRQGDIIKADQRNIFRNVEPPISDGLQGADGGQIV